METSKVKNAKLYRSVAIASLGNQRRGKHHDMTAEILRQLKTLRGGMALEIPLADVGGVELANLRSAVHRAAAAEHIAIETQSDDRNFYLWVNEKS